MSKFLEFPQDKNERRRGENRGKRRDTAMDEEEEGKERRREKEIEGERKGRKEVWRGKKGRGRKKHLRAMTQLVTHLRMGPMTPKPDLALYLLLV